MSSFKSPPFSSRFPSPPPLNLSASPSLSKSSPRYIPPTPFSSSSFPSPKKKPLSSSSSPIPPPSSIPPHPSAYSPFPPASSSYLQVHQHPPAAVPTPSHPDLSSLVVTRDFTRPSTKKTKVISSPFLPQVPAKDRIRSWSSPYSEARRSAHYQSLPPPLVNLAYQTVDKGLVEGTQVTYGAGLKSFHIFCDKTGVDHHQRMPASAVLITAFIGFYSGTVDGDTMRSWLSGVRAWHVAHGAHWNGDDEWVSLGRATANREGAKFSRKPRPPVTIEHLHALRNALDLSSPFHAAVWATATTTFFGCRRLGETTVKATKTFDPTYNVTNSVALHFRRVNNSIAGVSFHIPWTKTTLQNGADISLTARTDALCPVAALLHHNLVNGRAPALTSLFAYKNTNNAWVHMTRSRFLKFVSGIWESVGLEKISGHCFRIGGTVLLLLAGVPPQVPSIPLYPCFLSDTLQVVAATGGWTSLAFLRYWRRMSDIIFASTSQAYSRAALNSLSSTIETFRISEGISISDVNSE